MPTRAAHSAPERTLVARVEALLADPAHREDPLREALAEVFDAFCDQIRQMDRIARIADRYQAAERDRGTGYATSYRDQLRRLEKIVRISDRYQGMMRDLNERLQWLSTRDVLTALPNRRFALQRLHEEEERARRTGRPFSVLLADIDHFKAVNDTLGHEAGDQVLAAVAARLAGSLRQYDVCSRWGGEEFLVLLPDTDAAAARESAQRLGRGVAEEPFAVAGARREITLSIGVATCDPAEPLTALLKRADDALYAAKRGGRNRVEAAAPPAAAGAA
jgi:diguanylate cyclase (GGDEF)-like protein